MPTYDFKCSTCEQRQIIHAGIKEEVKAICTNCETPMLKVFAAPPVTFKGSGWASKEK